MGYYCAERISILSDYYHQQVNDVLPSLRKVYDELMRCIHFDAMSVSGGVRSVAYIDTYNFAVGVINDIKERMEDSIEDIEKSNADALFRICQEDQLSLEERTLGIFDDMVEYTMCSIEFILGIANRNHIFRIVIYGEEYEIENYFWSESEYSRLVKELNDYEKELENIQSRYRIRDIEKRCREIEVRIIQISVESVAKAILSQARVETIEVIISDMEKIYWILKGLKEGRPECNYMGGEEDHDWRKGVYAVLENNLREGITVIVDTVSGTHNQLIVYQHSGTSAPYFDFLGTMDWINKELGDLDYSVTEISFGEGNIPEMESAELLGKAQSSDILCNIKPTNN